jgi:hypothetical protein
LNFDREDGWKVADNGFPGVAPIGGTVNLAPSGAEVDTARFEGID